jgi:Uma2 family endonuclease
MHMPGLYLEDVEVPFDVRTLEGFRNWMARTPARPGRASFVRGDVFVEMNQSYRTHEPVAKGITHTLLNLTDELGLGRYFLPPSWITYEPAGLSTEPDGFYATFETLRSGRLTVASERPHEMVGAADFVLEVVSKTSARKDRTLLRRAYADARVGEYWLVDARREEANPDFRLLVLKGAEYEEVTPDPEGWRVSPTWGRSFRLRRLIDPAGLPDFRLDVRA